MKLYKNGDFLVGAVVDKKSNKSHSVDRYAGWYAYVWDDMAWIVRYRYPNNFIEENPSRKVIPMKVMKEMLEIVGIISIGTALTAEDNIETKRWYLDKTTCCPKVSIKDLFNFQSGSIMFDDNYIFRPIIHDK